MRYYSKLLIIILFLFNTTLIAQETFSFFIKVPNKKNVPIVSHNRNGNRILYSRLGNTTLNKLYNSYKIFNCRKVFKNSNETILKDIYIVECNDKKLMFNLKKDFGQTYPFIESAQGETLHIPDDYGLTGGYLKEQIELDYIRAPEAWDITTGSDDIIIGIADTNFLYTHEDFINTLDVVVNVNGNQLTSGDPHGNKVASYAAADTNNGKGVSAIGYDSYMYAGAGTNVSTLDDLSYFQGVKVVNASWLTHSTLNGIPSASRQFEQISINDIVKNRKIVVVAAAGNGEKNPGNPNSYVFPASYKDVISVSTVGHSSGIWWPNYESFLDEHEYLFYGQTRSFQHNDSIDIVAPGYGMVAVDPWSANGWANNAYGYGHSGTSYSAPMVAGTVALMFDVNYCLDPKEVETILKLTAVKIDALPQNIQYYGKLGAGKLDAYEAVKMSKDMADAFGTVEVKNRILYRPWFYKLETAPYEIKMTNNDITGGSKLKFKARSNIEILSGDYYPSAGGYIDLSIDETLALDCPPPPTNSARNSSKKSKNNINDAQSEVLNGNVGFSVFPNPTKGLLNIVNNEDLSDIFITDITGKIVYSINDINSTELQVNMSKFSSGIYFIKINMNSGEIKSVKVIKD